MEFLCFAVYRRFYIHVIYCFGEPMQQCFCQPAFLVILFSYCSSTEIEWAPENKQKQQQQQKLKCTKQTTNFKWSWHSKSKPVSARSENTYVSFIFIHPEVFSKTNVLAYLIVAVFVVVLPENRNTVNIHFRTQNHGSSCIAHVPHAPNILLSSRWPSSYIGIYIYV